LPRRASLDQADLRPLLDERLKSLVRDLYPVAAEPQRQRAALLDLSPLPGLFAPTAGDRFEA